MSAQLTAAGQLVSHLPRVDVDAETTARVMNGAMLPVDGAFVGDGPWRVHGADGALLGVYEKSWRTDDGGVSLVKPAVVLTAGG